MYKKILIATDGSKPSDRAVDHGVKLAKSIGSSIVFVTVTELWTALALSAGLEGSAYIPVEAYEDSVAASAKKTLAKAQKVAERDGVTFEVLHVPDRRPSEGIIETAKKKKCDLIVVGSHGRRGVDRLLLGSQAYEVLTESKVPVLVVR